jgi:multidrug efflux pump subunit AcrA (membrane-fusion protein)
MFASSLALTIALALAADGAPSPQSTGDAVIPVCSVASIERQEVPGADPGVLMEMLVKEGMKVTNGQELGLVDDREAKAQLIVKQLDSEAADQEAKSNIGVLFATATADVAHTAWKKLERANEGAKGAVAEIDVLKTKLEWEKATLQIKKAEEDHVAAGLTAKAKAAEAKAAEIGVERRILRAPFSGVVLKVKKHVGEWVAAGEPVVELIRVDRLSIRGGLQADQWPPADIEGRKVTVEVLLPRGRVEKVAGQIVFVSPQVVNGKLEVWAEIDIPTEKDGRPLVPAGLTAKMTIHVKQPVAAPPRPVAAVPAPLKTPDVKTPNVKAPDVKTPNVKTKSKN